MVCSHLLKILERVILNKIYQLGGGLLKSGSYKTKTGFKTGSSTHKNLRLVIQNVLLQSRTPSQRDVLILVDFKKAFDSVKRSFMWKILTNRAKTENDPHS